MEGVQDANDGSRPGSPLSGNVSFFSDPEAPSTEGNSEVTPASSISQHKVTLGPEKITAGKAPDSAEQEAEIPENAEKDEERKPTDKDDEKEAKNDPPANECDGDNNSDSDSSSDEQSGNAQDLPNLEWRSNVNSLTLFNAFKNTVKPGYKQRLGS
ncbi:hypothetical protein P280DRAFT_522992 [Massarina eburnea CBS 473.64]|uniref:Uncharacterized protein n=1 Tax=Massarina eburnea CBS 473.64 TaxID=1395130 RepID=A0A6A6RNC1_9PLEO|nr:hypothetical protein P280DRAFT_522992 [Massarina eburnea CBS 473.64]